MTPIFDTDWRALSMHVGAGRFDPEFGVTLTLANAVDQDLLWANQQGAEMIRCSTVDWLNWLAPFAPTDRFEHYPAELLPALTDKGFSALKSFFSQANFMPAVPKQVNPVIGWHYLLTLQQDDRRLTLSLENWSSASLLRLTEHWQGVLFTTEVMSLSLALAIGQTVLSYGDLRQLQPGDGILLSQATDIHASEMWLYQDRPLVEIIMKENDLVEVTRSLLDQSDSLQSHHHGDYAPQGYADIPLTVVAEVGQMTLTMAQLSALQPGQLLEGNSALAGQIKLTVNGCCIGYGSLIEIQQRWIIRIESLFGNEQQRWQEEKNLFDDDSEIDTEDDNSQQDNITDQQES